MKLAVLMILVAVPVWADAPLTSIRPQPRGPVEPVVMGTKSPVFLPEETQSTPAIVETVEKALPLSVAMELPELDLRLLPKLPEQIAKPGPRTLVDERPQIADMAPPEGAVRPRPRGIPFSGPTPRPRPARFARPSNPASAVDVVQVSSAAAVLRSPRPEPRPENLRRRSVVAAAAIVPIQPEPPVRGNRRGSVCGDRSIRGEEIGAIPARMSGCGLTGGVRVTEVDGLRLSTPATIDCVTAQALRRWVTDSVKPNVGRLGGGPAGLHVMASYNCRTRNNQRGARVSEHGRGRAIDIGAIILKNGSSITVLRGWRDATHGQILRALHSGACGIFGTVLGPNSDRFHQNHFHFDTARYRSGAYCR